MRGYIAVGGSISVSGARYLVWLENVGTQGPLKVTNYSGGSYVVVHNDTIRGALSVTDNTAGGVLVASNKVDGNATVRRNKTDNLRVHDNGIRGSLSCNGNTPSPEVFRNKVSGASTEQCKV